MMGGLTAAAAAAAAAAAHGMTDRLTQDAVRLRHGKSAGGWARGGVGRQATDQAASSATRVRPRLCL